MSHGMFRLVLLGTIVAIAGPSLAAQRSFVSTSGNDANTAANCSLSQPCRSFGSALTVTDPNGEIIVLDSGGYGRVTIDKSVAITSPPGIYAGISVFAGFNGVDIGTPGIRVVLRGLTINGQGGNSGILISDASDVIVDHCTIANMPSFGILVQLPTNPLRLTVSDSVLSLNHFGVRLEGGSQLVVATITRTRIERSANGGILALNNVDLHLADGIISGNSIGTGFSAISAVSSGTPLTTPVMLSLDAMHVIDNGDVGVQVFASGAGETHATISRSTIARNDGAAAVTSSSTAAAASADLLLMASTVAQNAGIGVQSSASAGTSRVVVSDSSIVDNGGVGLSRLSGTFYTRGNNTVRGNNGADIAGQTNGTITALTPL